MEDPFPGKALLSNKREPEEKNSRLSQCTVMH
jgi:hypothetical protein